MLAELAGTAAPAALVRATVQAIARKAVSAPVAALVATHQPAPTDELVLQSIEDETTSIVIQPPPREAP